MRYNIFVPWQKLKVIHDNRDKSKWSLVKTENGQTKRKVYDKEHWESLIPKEKSIILFSISKMYIYDWTFQ